jgi:hypothetical protein
MNRGSCEGVLAREIFDQSNVDFLIARHDKSTDFLRSFGPIKRETNPLIEHLGTPGLRPSNDNVISRFIVSIETEREKMLWS